MAKTAYINARVETKLKTDAQKVLREVGVNTSDAVSMFLRQVVLHDGLPFEVRVPNKESRRALAEFKSGKKRKLYTGTTEEIFDAILKER
ncbi:MAG TPA: type II toxin-antitoxin system RelB/DinJ family antitoxin [Candidatus Paceibacterota bacterium]